MPTQVIQRYRKFVARRLHLSQGGRRKRVLREQVEEFDAVALDEIGAVVQLLQHFRLVERVAPLALPY